MVLHLESLGPNRGKAALAQVKVLALLAMVPYASDGKGSAIIAGIVVVDLLAGCGIGGFHQFAVNLRLPLFRCI